MATVRLTLHATVREVTADIDRIDCLRMRFHPCFRLPADPMPPDVPDLPQVFALDSGIVASASTGIMLILVFMDGTFRDYFDYTNKPEREVIISDKMLRGKIPEISKTSRIELRIISAGQGEATVDDFARVLKNSRVQLPNGCGVAYRSQLIKATSNDKAEPQQNLVLHSSTGGRLLVNIRAYHTTRLEGMEFVFEDQSTQLFGNKDADNIISSDFPIDARKGESLVGFSIKGNGTISGLGILTSFGRKSKLFGGPTDGGFW